MRLRPMLALPLTVILPAAACLESNEPLHTQTEASVPDAEAVVLTDAAALVVDAGQLAHDATVLDAAAPLAQDASAAGDSSAEPSADAAGLVKDFGECQPG